MTVFVTFFRIKIYIMASYKKCLSKVSTVTGLNIWGEQIWILQFWVYVHGF